MGSVTNYEVEYFSSDTGDKMLKNGKPVKKISFEANDADYTVEYDPKEKNYWIRKNERLVKKVAYKNGVLHGKYCGYKLTSAWPVGIEVWPRLAVEGYHINGKKVGRWYYRNEDGTTDIKLFIGDREVAECKGKDEIGKSIKDSYLVLTKLKGKGSK